MNNKNNCYACAKCGYVHHPQMIDDFNNPTCNYCGNILLNTKYTLFEYLVDLEKNNEIILETIVKPYGIYDSKIQENTDKTIDTELSNRVTPSVKPQITCPYCKSTNTSKVGVISRSVSFGVFGFGSGKVGKQWHCNDCRSDF